MTDRPILRVIEVISERKLAQKRRQARGALAERLVLLRLQHMGLQLVEPVHVGCKVIRGRKIYIKPVSGDFRAIVPVTGKSVLVEVKCRDEDSLSHSDLETHQLEWLSLHEDFGGCSLLAWYHLGEIALLEWSRVREYLIPLRKSLSWATACERAVPDHHRVPQS